MVGKSSAQMTAKIVIASAKRLIDVRHFWRNRKRIAEISVPAWPMPTQNTKLTMAKPQLTGWLRPQTPVPSQTSQPTETPRTARPRSAMAKEASQPLEGGASTTRQIASVIEWKLWLPSIRGGGKTVCVW